MPSARFATDNYFRGGWHPFGFIGIDQAAEDITLTNLTFDSPAFDDSLSYKVPEALRSVAMPLIPTARVVTQWTADPKKELINPWRYRTLDADTGSLQKQTLMDGPVKVPTGGQGIRLTGDFGKGSRLNYTIGKDYQFPPGLYRFSCRVRGTPGLTTGFEGRRRLAWPY